ncbi:MAG: hypothetical protein WD295_06565, partial [Bacteroidota bacterium]
CLAVLVLMALMKVAGRWGFRRVVGGLTAVYLSFVYIFFKYSNPIKLVEEVGKFYPNVDLYLAQLDPTFTRYLPNHWISEFLFFLAKNDLFAALKYGALLVAVTSAAFVLVLLVANAFYYKSWLVAFQVQASSAMPSATQRRRLVDFRRKSFFSPVVDALLKKEFFQFFREPSQWIHLSLLLVLVTVFVMSVRKLNFMFNVPDLPALTYLVLFAFSGFLSASLALRFVFPMISLEGNSFWSILSAPVSPRTMYVAKYVLALVLVSILALVVSYFSNSSFVRFTREGVLLGFGMFTSFWISLAMVSVNLGLGGYFVNFQEKNPIRIASSQGATLTFLITLVFLIVLVATAVIPLSVYFEALGTGRPYSSGLFVGPSLVFMVLSLILSVVGFLIGLRSLKRDF